MFQRMIRKIRNAILLRKVRRQARLENALWASCALLQPSLLRKLEPAHGLHTVVEGRRV